MKNRSEFVISTTDIKEEGLTIDSELDISMVSIEDDPALEFIDIKLLGKIRRINKSEYIFEAKVSGLCHLSCSVCLEVFKLDLDENSDNFEQILATSIKLIAPSCILAPPEEQIITRGIFFS